SHVGSVSQINTDSGISSYSGVELQLQQSVHDHGATEAQHTTDALQRPLLGNVHLKHEVGNGHEVGILTQSCADAGLRRDEASTHSTFSCGSGSVARRYTGSERRLVPDEHLDRLAAVQRQSALCGKVLKDKSVEQSVNCNRVIERCLRR